MSLAGPEPTTAPRSSGLRWVDVVLGGVVTGYGILSALAFGNGAMLLIAVGMGLAAALYRRAPAYALALVWATAAVQIYNRLDVALVQIAALLVSYGAARYGRTATVWLSGLSIPAGAAIALVYVREYGTAIPVVESWLGTVEEVASLTTLTAGFVLVLAVIGGPWLLGLVLRMNDRYRRSTEDRQRAEADAVRAQEIATVRAEQARLARDVHDVVGHSLTVILAQADSAQFMSDAEIIRIRAVMANIATSARQSLGDVRHVLSETLDGGGAAPQPPGELDTLLDGVRAAGNDVRSRVEGAPQPLAPELDVTAYRVLQEMLTNALKHGSRGAPITVVRFWGPEYLCLQVTNLAAAQAIRSPAGVGLPGMQRRLETVGGALEVRRDDTADATVFTATAWVPLRGRTGL